MRHQLAAHDSQIVPFPPFSDHRFPKGAISIINGKHRSEIHRVNTKAAKPAIVVPDEDRLFFIRDARSQMGD